jgi:hypothetical protein
MGTVHRFQRRRGTVLLGEAHKADLAARLRLAIHHHLALHYLAELAEHAPQVLCAAV